MKKPEKGCIVSFHFTYPPGEILVQNLRVDLLWNSSNALVCWRGFLLIGGSGWTRTSDQRLMRWLYWLPKEHGIN